MGNLIYPSKELKRGGYTGLPFSLVGYAFLTDHYRQAKGINLWTAVYRRVRTVV
ncbi:hypothetical protein [Pricia sp.]|uniref:hypothetical protein n=1 Tax=Pricia sp. TaxID=2268138 RepID=UPI0035943175